MLIVGVVGKDGSIEGILSSRIVTDGTDSTNRIIHMIAESRFKEQIRIVALNGIALAGLNVVDVPALERKLGVKVAIMTRNRPRPTKLLIALKTFAKLKEKSVERRVALVKEQAKIKPVNVNGFYMQSTLERYEASAFATKLYDALRLSHLISSGISNGESTGRV